MSKSVLAVGTMVSAMVLASMAAGLTAVEGASQTRTVTLLDQAPRRDEPLEQPRRVCGHLDQRNGEPVAADVRRTNILGTYALHQRPSPTTASARGARKHQGVPHHNAAARNLGEGGEHVEGALRPAEHIILFPKPVGNHTAATWEVVRWGGSAVNTHTDPP